MACASSSVTLQLVHPSLPEPKERQGLCSQGGLLMQAQHRWVCPQPRADTGPGRAAGHPSAEEKGLGPTFSPPCTSHGPSSQIQATETDDHTIPCGYRRGHQLSHLPTH